ncbi:tail fiber protein [Lysinibacillus fusiformis]
MAEPFLGEVRLFSFDKIPQNWLPCDGTDYYK